MIPTSQKYPVRFVCNLVVIFGILPVLGCSASRVDWSNPAFPSGTGFLTKGLEHERRVHNYSVFVPRNYNPRGHYPVILFLHGLFESGDDGRKCVTVGLGPAVARRAATFPFIVVFPQSTGDWRSESAVQLAMGTLNQVLRDYPAADRGRVFLTGISTGGDATWAIGARYPARFAALIPISSGPSLTDAVKLTGLPIRAFHNQVDPFRSAGIVREMCQRINQAGGNATYTEYPEFGHDSWTQAYGDEGLFDWMMRSALIDHGKASCNSRSGEACSDISAIRLPFSVSW